MVFNIILIEFDALGKSIRADIFIRGVHCGYLLFVHSYGSESHAVVGYGFKVSAIRTAAHIIRRKAVFGETFLHAFADISEFLAVCIDNTACARSVDNLGLEVILRRDFFKYLNTFLGILLN